MSALPNSTTASEGDPSAPGAPRPDPVTLALTDIRPLLVEDLPEDVQEAIDGLVHDIADLADDAGTPDDKDDEDRANEDDDDLCARYDHRSDLRSKLASDINNRGIGGQLAFLQEQGVPLQEVAGILLPAAASAHAALILRRLARP